jgi:putative spermidine/putrescine transport system substrate-binding protein
MGRETGSNRSVSRRKFLCSTGALGAAAVAGCNGGGAVGGGGDSQTYEVGYGDSETTVSEDGLPTEEQLYVYCVQSGWMNWPSVMAAFEEEYSVELNDNDRSSGEALQDARANVQNPTHSAFNGGYSYAIQAMNDDLTQAYKPANWDAVPEDAKTDNGHCTGTRKVTTALTYRKDVFEERGIGEPTSWEDLRHPDVTQDLALQTPQAAVGLAAALSINNAYGGDLGNVQPVVDYYRDITDGGAEFTDNFLAQFTSGEYASFVRYDYSALDLKYNSDELDEEQVGIALLEGPEGKGAFNALYGYALLDGAPNPEAAKLFMDYVLSLEGQQHFLDAYARPIRAPEMDMPDEFPDQSRYDETEFTVDQGDLVENQDSIIEDITRGADL